jgi:hypothetical protein
VGVIREHDGLLAALDFGEVDALFRMIGNLLEGFGTDTIDPIDYFHPQLLARRRTEVEKDH